MDNNARKLTPQEAADYIGLSLSRLAKHRMTGDGPAFLQLGRRVVYQVSDLEAWLDSKRTTKTPPKIWKGGRGSTSHRAVA